MDVTSRTKLTRARRQLASRDGLALLLAVVVFAFLVIPYYTSIIALCGSLLVCVYCFALGPTKVDVRALMGLGILAAATAFSTVVYFGDITRGQTLFLVLPALYLASSYLGKSSRKLLLKLCVAGAGVVALIGLVIFSVEAVNDMAWRARAVLGSPNALGIFLVIAWLCLVSMCERGRTRLLLLEPLLLACLALTLSGGSLLSLAFGLGVLFYQHKKSCAWRELGSFVVNVLARMAIAFVVGVMFYIAANRTTIPWFCFVLTAIVLFICVMWPKVLGLLDECWVLNCVLVLLCGAVFVMAIFSFRQSAFSTFAERIAQMENGLGYLFYYPWVGLGYGQWSLYNFQDADVFFNVVQIHNTPLHIGVEYGLIAMASVMYLIIHRFSKGGDNTPGAMTFVVHSMIDNPLFSRMSLFALLVCTTPRRKGTRLDRFETRVVLVVLMAILLYCLLQLLF